MTQWKKIEQGQLPHIKKHDFWVYAREYVSNTGYQGGPTNSLILNFKKSPSKNNTSEWQHREDAVKQFKEDIEVCLFFSALVPISQVALTSVPSSKKKDHPEYDDRFEDLFKEFLKSHPQWIVEWPVEIKENIKPSHKSREKNPDILRENYLWKGFRNKEPEILCICDDIITTGAHLRAMSDFLIENNYKGQIIGICWAKTVWL